MTMRLISRTLGHNVYADARDEINGNASHHFEVRDGGNEWSHTLLVADFQHGPRNEPTSRAGAFDDDLLAIVEDRMEGFQTGKFPHALNEKALEHIKAAREALAERAAERARRGVLGKNVA